MLDATFACPDLTTFARLDELGLEAIGQRLEPDRAVLACRVVEPDEWCRRCGCQGRARDTVVRRLAHEPVGWRPTVLLVRVRRYHCTGCGHVWRQDTSKAAEPRAKLSRRGLRWALEAIVVGRLPQGTSPRADTPRQRHGRVVPPTSDCTGEQNRPLRTTALGGDRAEAAVTGTFVGGA